MRKMIHEGTLFTIGYWTVKPGKEEVFLEKWREFAQWTLDNMKGAKWACLIRDLEQKNKFISFGPWESAESIAVWRESSKFREAFAEFRELCDQIQPATMREVIHINQ
jgi:heme-degrading monooxygenase HmoA